MAKIDMANIPPMQVEHANISDAVGNGEKNEKNDVLLIQALFKLVGYNDRHARKFFGLAVKDLPEATGSFDEKTRRAIWAFQYQSAHRLLNVDGKIHPASYQNRVIKNAFKAGTRLMIITLLNIEAPEGAVINHSDAVIPAIKKIAPSIIFNNQQNLNPSRTP
jgi:hypothetical protein